MHEAYKERDLTAIEERENHYDNFLSFKNQLNKNGFMNGTTRHLIFPVIEESALLDELLSTLDFALPNRNEHTLIFALSDSIPIEKKNALQKQDPSLLFIDPQSMDNYIEKSVVLIHDMSKVLDLKRFNEANRVEIIDKEYFSTVESDTLRFLYYQTLLQSQRDEFEALSKRNFLAFQMRNCHKNKAYCFTTGPSFDTYKSYDIPKNSLKVICNSIVKNEEFLDYIGGADILTFADPVFHFGPSKYAKAFREDVLKVVKKYNTFLVVPKRTVPLLLWHYPDIKDNIIGIGDKAYHNIPDHDDFFVKSTANILTLYMIPVASSLADTIFLIGADGRKDDEKYFWKHSSNVQYDDKMEDAFVAHPSFFRDRDYKDYYANHCHLLEEQLSYGESYGKVYASITSSYIPALRERWIDLKRPQTDLCLEIKERRKASLKKEQNICSKPEGEIQKENYDFTVKLNILYAYVDKLKQSKKRIAIYGNGLVGNIFISELKEQVVVVFDKFAHNGLSDIPIEHPSKIENYSFDILLITVLGRENEIRDALPLQSSVILTLDLTQPENIVFIDSECNEYEQKNLCGPYTFESRASLDETKVIAHYFSSSKGVMIDVGAHFGSSAEEFLRKGWRVYCYEPDRHNRAELKKRLDIYPNCTISDKAVSNKSGQYVDFYTSNESTGISTLSAFSDKHEKCYSVMTSTLKEELQINRIKEVDFLKIDTEGYDLIVLKGFDWEHFSPKVIECEFEDNKTRLLGYNVYDTIEFLKQKGYTIYVSEWHPIVRYGIRHQWRRLFKFDNHEISSKAWGNLMAFYGDVDEEHLITLVFDALGIGGH